MILLTSYASKMMQGAGESQDGLSTPIFNMDAQRWTPSGVIVNPDFQQITLSNLVQKMKQSGASEQQIAMRVLQYQIAGQAIGSYSMVEQVDALYHSGVSLNTVINAIALKRGKALSINEIKAITSRYNNNAGSLVTANGQVIKNNGHQSTASESRGAQQSGGKGKVDGAHKTEQVAGKGTTNTTKPTVTAELEVNGHKFVDTNQTARPIDKANANESTLISDKIKSKEQKLMDKGKTDNLPLPNSNMSNAHAEIGAIHQAHKAGVAKGADLNITVKGKDVCNYCRSDIVSAAKAANAKSVTIHAVDEVTKLPKTYYWESGMKKLREVKKK
jgi:hypothetical protein